SAALLADELPGPVERAVLVVRGQDLVPRPEGQGPGHHVHAGGGVGHVDDVIWGRAEERRERLARLPHQIAEPVVEELDGLPFEFQLPALVGIEHRPRAGPERAVVEVDDVGAQEKELPEAGGVGSVLHGGYVRSALPSPGMISRTAARGLVLPMFSPAIPPRITMKSPAAARAASSDVHRRASPIVVGRIRSARFPNTPTEAIVAPRECQALCRSTAS